jgi:hypothetical protein
MRSAATTIRDTSLWHRRADWIVLALIVAVAVISQWPVLTGRDTYCFRDIGTTHRPAWAVATQLGDARGNETSKDITPDVYKFQDMMMQGAYEYVFGGG